MGKKKKSTGSSKPKVSATSVAALESKLGLLNNLNSSSPNDRAVACGVASHMLAQQDDPAKTAALCKLLLRAGVVEKLVQCVCQDPNEGVASAAAKSLRNFCLTGPAACEAFVKLRAPSAILGVLNSDRFKSGGSLPAVTQEFLSHIFSLLAAVASNVDDKSIEACLRPDFLPAVFTLLSTATDPHLRMEIVSLLLVVSEDNPGLGAALLSQPPMLAQLHKLLGSEPYTRSAVAGVLLNAISATSAPLPMAAEITSAVLAAVSSMLDLEPLVSAQAMLADLQQRRRQEEAKQDKEDKEQDKEAMQEGDKEPMDTKARKASTKEDADGITQDGWDKLTWEQLTVWRSGAQGVKQSLEVLTNVATLLEEHSGAVQGLAEHLIKEITTRQLPNKVFRHLRCGATSTEQGLVIAHQELSDGFLSVFAPEEAKAAVSLLHSVRSAAGSCAANFFLHFPVEVLEAGGAVVQEACSICRALEPWMGQEEWAVKELEGLTTLIWNAARKGTSLDKGQLQCVMALGRANTLSDEIRSNVAGILGVVGASPAHFAFNFVIGTSLLALIERCAQDENSSLELAAEAVNSLIDVYTEDNVHSAQVTQLELLPRLAAFFAVLNKRYKRVRSSVDPILQDRMEETLENLAQFIEYKKMHI